MYGTNSPNAIDTAIQAMPSSTVPLYGFRYLANFLNCSIDALPQRHRGTDKNQIQLSPCLGASVVQTRVYVDRPVAISLPSSLCTSAETVKMRFPARTTFAVHVNVPVRCGRT